MTETIRIAGNPPVPQTPKSAINSIVATAKTAQDLEYARRKATRIKGLGIEQISRAALNELNEPVTALP